ncbi:MAG: gliding motility-associated C-terminal domain-containing protein [Bacteroidales bacterium]|nr:gliding motility-associated C-terminal domain-containing protein [Bacteroidales bacterium]
MRNTKDIFHLGIVNGGAGTGCFYGYFSDYNEFNPKTLVIETGSSGGRICSGETLNLYASGGTTYDWDPVTYLDDPTSETPTAINVESSINYTVTISGACNETEIRHVNLQVGGPVTAAFDADNYTGCAVPATAGGIPEFTFNFTSSSTGDFKRWWSWQLGATGTSTEFMYGDDNLANDARTVSLTLENDTDEILEYHIKLATSDKDEFCFREVTKIIRVYPYIDISASRTIVGNPDCQPLTVNFTSTPIGNPDGPSYKWVFGDGNSAATQHATNTYNNTAPPYNPINYTAEVTITDKWNVCTATDNVLVRVPPYLEAGFTANPVEGCSPLQVTNFSNTSKGAGSYSWKLYRLGAPDVEVGSSITGSPPDISSASTLLVNNRTDNLEEVYRLDLEVTNASGCLKTYSQEFTVYPNPTATVSIDDPGAPDINCSPLQIDLSASTIRNTNSFQWLVDGVSRLSNPDPIGSPPANYTGSLTLENITNAPIAKVISYKATNNWGCDYVAPPLNVNVQPHIHSEIVLNPEVICPDSETGLFDVQILDAKIVADGQYEWLIDGVSQGIDTDIGTRTFDYNTLTKNANGEAFINLQLVVENAAGCIKTDNQQIKVNPQVSVDFDAYIGASLINPGAGGTGTTLCPPETLDFTSSTTYANSYQWKFGGLKEATTQNASLDVENNGSSAFDLPVTLTASNSYGCSGTVTKTYTIEPEVITNFDIESLAGCAPFTLDVSAVDNGTTYNWEFVGQNRTGADQVFNPVENKTGVSLYETITLEAVRGNCTLVKNDVVVTIYPEVQAQWDFTAPTDYCAPVSAATFDNTSDLYAGGSVTNIQWQVFDGATLVTSSSAQNFTPSLPNTSHTAQKTYDVHLTATSADGCVGQVDNQITVNPNPLAKFEVDVTDNCTPTVINVTNNSVTTGANPYNWDWDTNGVATDESASPIEVTYSNNTELVEGKWIELEVTNQYGCKDFYDYTFEVYPELSSQLALSSSNLTANCDNDEYVFVNSATQGNSISEYRWLVKNTTTGNSNTYPYTSSDDFSQTFRNFGTSPEDYTITLTAENHLGCTQDDSYSFTVYPRVIAAQSFVITDECNGTTIDLTNASSNEGKANSTFVWEFTTTDDGADKTVTSPSDNLSDINLINNHAVNTALYNLQFTASTVWNQGAAEERTCLQMVTGNSVTVYPNLDLTFDIPDAECSTPTGVEITFARDVATSSGGDVNDISIAWDFGDGNTASSNFDDVTHTFTNISNQPFTTATKFTATQLATGCTFEDNIPVTVYPTVTAAQSFILGNLCGGEVEVTLANASSNTGVTTGTNNFEWRFTPDDLTNGAPANFTSEGSYSLVNNGSIDPVTYSLEFFTETVWNEGAADHKSCSDVITPATQVKVYPELLPVFLAPDAACSGQTGVPLTFVKDNTASKGGNPADVTIEWNFGDGNTQSSNFDDVTHTFLNIDDVPFTTATEYTATQLATGCTVTDAIPVTVFPRVTAAQSFNITDECNGVTLDLTNASTNKSIANSTFSWAFTTTDDGGADLTVSSPGDALSGVNLVNSHQTNPVTYSLSFRAQTDWADGNICQHVVSGQDVTVYPILNPIYDIPPAVCSGLNGADLEFVKNASSSGGGVNDVSLQWDFSDGNTRTTTFDPSVTKQFTNLSDEDFITSTKIFATQIATGCTVQREVDVRVHPKVESIFTFELGDVCEYPLPVTFANASKFSKAQTGVPTQFIWDYGYELNGNPEGETLAPNDISHTYHFYNDEPNQVQEYDVSLTITQTHDISGEVCANTAARKIQVYPEMLPSFNLPTIEGCNPLTVSFSNTSTGVNLVKADGTTTWNGQFVWDLGNGSTSSSITPATREYGHADKTQSHIYNISLTATNPLGCVKTATTSTPQVTVYPWVDSSFTVDRIEGCTPLDVTLSNTFKSDEYAYLWNFVENGTNASTNSSDLEEPGTITFTNPLGATDELLVQKPQIQLKTSLDPNKYSYQTDEAGCVKTATPIEVSVFPHVYPDFEATLEGCHPLEDVEFTNTSNVFGETNNGEYTWDFDNGVQSNVLDPTQTFRNPDFVKDTTFNVKLTAESQHGCIDDTIKTVTVYPKPKARIELEEYMGCSPFDLAITNSSVGKGWGSTLEFTFDFGDASDPYVTTDPADPASANHEYRNLNNEIEPYTLWLTVETENECTDETSQTIHVYPEVTARFDTEEQVYEQCNPFEVQFENTSTNSWSYLWNFDDGGITSSSVAPNYRFVNNDINDRTYDVTLTAMSEFDCEDTDTLAITVFAAPIVDFVIMPPHQVFPQDGTLPVVYFKNLSRPKGIPHTWPHKWTFGDGDSSISTEETIEHTYEHWGPKDEDFRYEVTLAISNEKCADTLSQKFTILPPEPISLFSANEYRACSPLEVNFYNESLFYLTDEDATAFEWRIDGEEEPFSTAFEPRWTFTEPGYYNVQLTVYGDGGEKHSYRTFRVYENPKASFEAMPERVTLPNARVHFYNFSERADSCIWVFGDNSFESNDWDPVHTYTEMGEYRVTLTAFSLNDDGTECVDIYSKFPAVWVLGSGRIRFPNAFVPSKLGSNGGVYDAIDYKNEVFHPVSEGVMEYRLQIFNRWGEQIFESNDINIGWDGYYKGKLASQGVYVWRAVGRFANGDMFDKRGNVTLLR